MSESLSGKTARYKLNDDQILDQSWSMIKQDVWNMEHAEFWAEKCLLSNEMKQKLLWAGLSI